MPMAEDAELGYVEGQLQAAAEGKRFASLPAEENVLLMMLTKAAKVQDEVLAELKPGDFADLDHRRLFEAMVQVAEDGGKIDMISVDAAFSRMFPDAADNLRLKMIGLTQFDGMKTGKYEAIGDHIRILKALSKRRAAIQAAEALAKGLRDPTSDVGDVLDRVRDLADGIETGGKLKWVPLDEVNIDTYDYLDKRSRGEIKALPTGIKSVDGIIGGLFGGEMTVVAARPSVGKTAFGLNIAMNAAKEGFRVGFVSCEMGKEGLGQRTLSRGAWVSGERLRKAEIMPEDWELLQNAMAEMQGMPFEFIFNDPANPEPITVEGVFDTVRDRARHEGIDLLVVDYIGIMGTKREFKENWLKVSYISRELKRLAMAVNIPVVALCQVNRAAQGRMPTMAELAQSGAVEQDADGIIFLHRPESHEDKSINPKDVAGFYAMQEGGSVYISICVAKQRNGSIGTVNVTFDASVMRYNEIMRA